MTTSLVAKLLCAGSAIYVFVSVAMFVNTAMVQATAPVF